MFNILAYIILSLIAVAASYAILAPIYYLIKSYVTSNRNNTSSGGSDFIKFHDMEEQ